MGLQWGPPIYGKHGNNGKENGNYFNGLYKVYGNNGKENGNYYNGLYKVYGNNGKENGNYSIFLRTATQADRALMPEAYPSAGLTTILPEFVKLTLDSLRPSRRPG